MKLTTNILLLCVTLTLIGKSSAETLYFALDNVFFQKEGSTNNLQQMHGYFSWNYTLGDFENGTGELLYVDIPGTSHGVEDLIVTIETGGIEISLDGSFHDDGIDVSLKFLNDLSPTGSSVIDTDPESSKFDIGGNGFYRGTIETGSVVPFIFTLHVTQASPTTIQATWTPNYPWCTLEQSSTLKPSSWDNTETTSPHDQNITAPSKMFYRLAVPE
ncbi:MAG: hypothetical protein ACSHX9_11340 [Luteolibacter sp.]